MTEKGHILTANRLADGAAVFLTASGAWSLEVDRAVLARDQQAAANIERLGQEAEAANHVVGAYLIAAERDGGHVRASHIRERIRVSGPTVLAGLKPAAGA